MSEVMRFEPFPSREQLDAITDIPSLMAIRDEAVRRGESIDTQLDFNEGTDDWIARAKAALTACKIVIKNIDRRIYILNGSKNRIKQAEIEADAAERKVRKAEANAKLLEKQAADRALATEKQREKTRTQLASFLAHSHFHKSFSQAALEIVGLDEYSKIMQRATDLHNEFVSNEVTKR